MAIKKSTGKTKPTAKAGKTVSPTITFIREIEHCVEKDNATLAKAYPKSLAEIEKEIKRAHKAITQAKKQSKKTKKVTPARSDKKDEQSSEAMKQVLFLLKNDKAVLLAGHKKFLALQKNTEKFEKAWAKKNAQPKKKSKKGSSVKKKDRTTSLAPESSVEQQPEN